MARATGVITCWWNYPLEDSLPFLECRDRICLVQNEAWHLEMLTNTSPVRECMDGRTDGWTDGQMGMAASSSVGGQSIEKRVQTQARESV